MDMEPERFVQSIRDQIPDLHGVAVSYAFTSSQRLDSTEGRLRLFADLDRAYSQAELKAWGERNRGNGVDPSAYSSAQILYTATPRFFSSKGDEIDDPLAVLGIARYGRLAGRGVATLKELKAAAYTIPTFEAAEPVTLTGRQLHRLLAHIPNTEETHYDEWLRIGSALHHATQGAEEGLKLWTSWSSRSPKHSPSEMRKKWQSFSVNRKAAMTTAGTLFHLARQHGYGESVDSELPEYNGYAVTPTEQISRLDEEERVIRLALERRAIGSGATAICDPVGVGKTRPLAKLARIFERDRLGQLLYLSPRHELHDQTAAAIAQALENPFGVTVLRGREYETPTGERMCSEWETWEQIQSVTGRHHLSRIMCNDGKGSRCQSYFTCAYQRQQQQAREATVVIASHEYLKLGIEAVKPTLTIVDESVWQTMLSTGHSAEATLLPAGAVEWLTEGNAEAIDQKALRERITAIEGNLPQWPEVLPSWSGARKVEAFKAWEGGYTPPELEVYRAVVRVLEEPERSEMWLDGELVRWVGQHENKIRRVDPVATEAARAKWAERHAAELAEIKDLTEEIGFQYLLDQEAPEERERLAILKQQIGQPKAKLTTSPVLFLDADGDPEIYSALFGEVEYHKGEVTDAEGISVTQVAQSWHQKRIAQSGSAGQLALLAQQMGGAGIIVPMGNADRADKIRAKEEPTEADRAELARLEPLLLERRVQACGVTTTMHFNAVAGMNTFERLESGIIAGRTEPPANEVELLGRALWPNAGLQLTGSYERQRARLTMANGAERWTEINGHPDNRVARVLSQIRDRGLQQSLGRWRYIHPIEGRSSQREIVYLGTVPLEMPISRIATEREILPSALEGELAERTGQAVVIPTGAKAVASLLGISKPTLKERVGWEELGKGEGYLKRDLLLRHPSPFSPAQKRLVNPVSVTYRAKGQRGSDSEAVVYSTDHAEIEAGLKAVVGGELVRFELEAPPAESFNDLLHTAKIAIDTRGNYQRAIAAKSWMFANLPADEIQSWFELARVQ